MLAAEAVQILGVQALHPERDAVDPGGAEGGELGGLHRGGVGFQRHFQIGCRGEQAGGVRDQGGNGFRRHQARCAAAEEDRVEAAWPEAGGFPGEFGAQGGGEAGLVDAVADMRVEIAVRALGEAKRPVDIECEGLHPVQHRGLVMSGQSSVDRVRAALVAAGVADSITAFPAGTRTAADAAAAVGCAVAQIAKSIVFRAGAQAVVVIASGVNRVDAAKLAAVIGQKVTRADADWIREVTGFAIGGVAPLGHLTPPIVVFDRDLLGFAVVWAAAGSPSHVFALAPDVLARISGAILADVGTPA